MKTDEKLLHIFYRDDLDSPTIHEYIEGVPRLSELLAVSRVSDVDDAVSNAIYIDDNRIHIRPDWLETRPAVIFPSEIPFNKNYFLGTVFGMLGNEERYPQYFTGYPAMLFIFDLVTAIAAGKIADSALENILSRRKFAHPFENYAFNHNVAVALNYGRFSEDINPDAIEAHYADALELAFEPAYKALTLKYYATFLTDMGRAADAAQLITQQHFRSLADYPRQSLNMALCCAEMKLLRFPPDEDAMKDLKEKLWETLQFFDRGGHRTIAALLWMDAATLANYSNSYSEALGYINKAITYFGESGQREMSARAQMVRGEIFYDWAQSGNPQFYRSALEAYQAALSVFNKEDASSVFADIHQRLGVIYAEMPDENKKRSIWAGLSAASFQESLGYYNKIDFPREFGMICNNFGNAYTKYPQGNRTDNAEKALGYYTEALSVRSAAEFPGERAVTILNFLEASWQAGNPGEDFNTGRLSGMQEKLNELRTLTDDEQLLAEADRHARMLAELEKNIG